MKLHLMCAIDITNDDNQTIKAILNQIQENLSQTLNLALDSVAFDAGKQETGESYDGFMLL